MKQVAPAAERNKGPILEVLREVLPESGLVLEIASGTGQHASSFASAIPSLDWQPTDIDPGALESIRAYWVEAALPNLRAPLLLDASSNDWPVQSADAIIAINMIHIAPWRACVGLLAGAVRLLPSGGPLVLYGPYIVDGDFIAPSNRQFDASLRAQNPQWGLREVRDVQRAALSAGLALDRVVPRPANNQVVVFRRV
ncbi:MAG TPA: DUF938 domain-containing protein [Polyangiaceae bacterium]|jgi:hypothetical protein